MANPRKFSEKIALHHQKQAEETAAFEAIMREVSGATRTALQNLKDIEQGRAVPRDRSRQVLTQQRGRGFPTRADCSPYGATYLSLPPDTSWRRTNSDSALHTSTMGQQVENILTSNTPPTHRRVLQVAEENSVQDNMKYWDPKKLGQVRPKSCEVPNINIYPSQEQDSGVHIPISNHAGSLPDLSVLQFPSPLATPLDEEEQNFTSSGSGGSNINLSPNINMSPTQVSPPQPSVSARRNLQSSPSPLVLTNVNQMRLPLSPPVSCVDPNSGLTAVSGSASPQSSSRVRQCMYSQVPQRQHPHGGGQQQVAQHQQVPSPHHVQTYSPPLHPRSHHHHQQQQQQPHPHQVQQIPHYQVQQSSHHQVQQTPHHQVQQTPHHQVQQTPHHQVQQTPHQTPHHQVQQTPHHQVQQTPHHQVQQTPHHHSSHMQSPHNPYTQQQQLQTQPAALPQQHQQQNQHHHHPSQPLQHHIAPQVHVTPPPCNESQVNRTKPSLTQYRNSESSCQSPTSPLSQTSYSPVQSPGLPPNSSSLDSSAFSEAFYIQQQQTNQLQHQLEQFNMLQDNQPSGLSSGNSNSLTNLTGYSISPQPLDFTEEDMQRLSSFYELNSLCNQQQPQMLNTPVQSHQQQSSQQQQTGQQQQQQQQQHHQQQPSSPNHLQQQLSPNHLQQQLSPQTSNKIPHIIFTGADDLSRQDFARELGNAITGFNDFDADYLPEEEALKIGLVPLDLDDVQMLTDPNLVTDAATEDSFKLDRQ